MPLEGHVLVCDFAVRCSGCLLPLGAIQLEDGFGFAFVDSVLDPGLLVFAAPERAFDLDMSSFLERAGKLCELLSPDDNAMPFGAGLPFASLVLPGSLRGKGESSNGCSVGGEPFVSVLTEEISWPRSGHRRG